MSQKQGLTVIFKSLQTQFLTKVDFLQGVATVLDRMPERKFRQKMKKDVDSMLPDNKNNLNF